MDYSASFARHFARLVSLLLHETSDVDEQKVSLRALVTLSRRGRIAIESRDSQLVANEQVIPGALTGVREVAGQMQGHSISQITIEPHAKASHLLGVARIIASDPAPDGGELARQKLTGLSAKGIAFVTPDPVVIAAEAPTVIVPAQAATSPAVAVASNEKPLDPSAILSKLLPPDATKMTSAEVIKALDAAANEEAMTKALDDVALLAEHSVRGGKNAAVADLLHAVVTRDRSAPEGELKRAYAVAIRRMSKPALLRGVASLIPKKPEKRQDYYEILERTGEDGAEAVIEMIAQAPTADDRKAHFEMLGVLEAAVPALKRMLGDSRWFVVRNAVDLLGDLAAKSAEDDLVGLLRHTDDRVRRSATNALLKLGTTDALKGVYEAVSDKSPEVRLQATAAISTRRDAKTANTLIKAIEDEDDADVQLAMIAALGKVATPDAITKLVKMAEPEGRLFKKKTASLRAAAVQALGEAKTPAALNALKELLDDKDREVRDAASRAMAQAAK